MIAFKCFSVTLALFLVTSAVGVRGQQPGDGPNPQPEQPIPGGEQPPADDPGQQPPGEVPGQEPDCPTGCGCGHNIVICAEPINFETIPINTTHLTLRHQNPIGVVVDVTFGHLHENLLELVVQDSGITGIDDYAFRQFVFGHLRSINFDNNLLTELRPEAFNSLGQSLTSVSLISNQISSLSPGVFSSLSRLESIHLSRNNLTTAPLSAFYTDSNPNSLTLVDLTRNPWDCTCELRPLMRFILNLTLLPPYIPYCRTPESLSNVGWDSAVGSITCPGDPPTNPPPPVGPDGGDSTTTTEQQEPVDSTPSNVGVDPGDWGTAMWLILLFVVAGLFLLVLGALYALFHEKRKMDAEAAFLQGKLSPASGETSPHQKGRSSLSDEMKTEPAGEYSKSETVRSD